MSHVSLRACATSAAAAVLAAALASCGDAGPSAGTAEPATSKTSPATTRVLRVSDLGYANRTVTAVVRLDRDIAANEAAFFVGSTLRTGAVPGPNQGVSPVERIGDRERHCYVIEARRLEPVVRPEPGSSTRFGFAARAEGASGKLTQVSPARFVTRSEGWGDGSGWPTEAASALGCGASRDG